MAADSSHANTGATEKRLSSRLTFVDKFVFPTAWLGGWGLGTLLLVVHPSGEGPPPLIFVAALAFISVFFWRWGFTIKRVVATGSGLRVSNYRREIFVPYEQISSVRENKLLGARPITVELRSRTAFGSNFRFIPYKAFVLFADHPAATFLLERAGAASRQDA